MAVVSVNETGMGGIAGELNIKLGQNRYTKLFKVVVDDPVTGPDDALRAAALPQRADPHPIDGSTVVARTRLITTESRLQFIVAVEYELVSLSEEDEEQQENPLLRNATVDWTDETVQEIITKDIDGNPIENSAGDPFDPSLQGERTLPVLTIIRNEATYNPNTAARFRDGVNDGNITIGGMTVPEEARCKLSKFNGSRKFENDVIFFSVIYILLFKVDPDQDPVGFNREVLDHGLHALDDDGKKFHITNEKDGTFISSPVKLNGQGGIFDPDEMGPVYGEFLVDKRRNFAQLQLPTGL